MIQDILRLLDHNEPVFCVIVCLEIWHLSSVNEQVDASTAFDGVVVWWNYCQCLADVLPSFVTVS